MSDSDSELSASPSPPQSPEASLHYQGPPSLERLVVHFVEAKRSLNATSHVYRANELVTNSRSLIEEIAALNAKNAYAKKGLDEQAETLDAIRDALIDDGSKVSDEFDATIGSLDKAHARLDKTLTQLRKTIVNAHEQPPAIASSTSDTEEESKTLFDFIDEATHENVLSSLRGLIDHYHEARSELSTDLSAFEATLKGIAQKLADDTNGVSDEPDRPTIYDEPPSSIPDLFHGMEEHATEMASLLENLVNHYDLSVTALRHTEGGGEAAKLAVQQAAELSTKDVAKPEESLYGQTVAEPISDEERHDMLAVLEKDAQEVEDVVVEIRDRATELEGQYESLSVYARKARLRNQTLRQVLGSMRDIRGAMPRHLESASSFRETWVDIRDQMQAKTTELADLSIFYEQFLGGYGKLLKEVERRKASEAAMKRIADKARKELDKLYNADHAAREEFMEDVGVFLPRDLGVWHGLEDDSTRWEVKPIYAEHEEGQQDPPRLLDVS
ncbi:Autophagy-related protein [Pseudocercospora fuligena]|uniref:Autophagy-related protein 17 n=1 Tax=Pseudocercospora fuligena TaxID=685502 RepID=A0A8H6RMJ5_9PEZI|nr:Autophagy-related protein [Pseudocercospora fuligena]